MKNFRDFVDNELLTEARQDDILKNLLGHIFYYMGEFNEGFIPLTGDYIPSVKGVKDILIHGPVILLPGLDGVNKVEFSQYESVTVYETNAKTEYKGTLSPSGLEIDFEGEKIKLPINADVKRCLNLAKLLNNKDIIEILIDYAETKEQVENIAKELIKLYTIGGQTLKTELGSNLGTKMNIQCDRFMNFYNLCK